jgi:hypothetical protein
VLLGPIWSVLVAANVINTFLVPAENDTALLLFEDAKTVVRANTLALEYVPSPTSNSAVVWP